MIANTAFATNAPVSKQLVSWSVKLCILKSRDCIVLVFFFDLSKVFDTLNHEIHIKKLERYGIQGVASDWFNSYLKNRTLVTKITTPSNTITYSEPFQITYGTALGICLGRLLFILFCNDIHTLPLNSSVILFPDDTMLFNSHKN